MQKLSFESYFFYGDGPLIQVLCIKDAKDTLIDDMTCKLVDFVRKYVQENNMRTGKAIHTFDRQKKSISSSILVE